MSVKLSSIFCIPLSRTRLRLKTADLHVAPLFGRRKQSLGLHPSAQLAGTPAGITSLIDVEGTGCLRLQKHPAGMFCTASRASDKSIPAALLSVRALSCHSPGIHMLK